MSPPTPSDPPASKCLGARLPSVDELRIAVRKKGFRVQVLAAHVGLNVRTLERRFREQLCVTPKTWIMRERINLAAPLLAAGFSNKEVAALLGYTCASNFCRDFKQSYGWAPQQFARRGERRTAL